MGALSHGNAHLSIVDFYRPEHVLRFFYAHRLDMELSPMDDPEKYKNHLSALVDLLLNTCCKDIIGILKEKFVPHRIKASHVPECSDFEKCYLETPRKLYETKKDISYQEMGYLLRGGKARKKGADLKYGEDQAKTAAHLGLACITKNKLAQDKPRCVINLTPFGAALVERSMGDREFMASILPKLCLYPYLLQNYFCQDNREEVLENDLSILSESTKARRIGNVRNMISIVEDRVNAELYGTGY